MKNGNKITKSFEKWSDYEVAETFHLRFEKYTPALKDWVSANTSIPQNIERELVDLCDDLTDRVGGWNETELLARFIHPLLRLVRFANREKKIEEYGDRLLVLPDDTDTYVVKGNVDWFVARGRGEPEKPYFFLHEYKRLKQSAADPLGQLLIAMVAAQKQNADGLPVYGAWIMGANWKFVLLDNDVYSESKTLDATDIGELRLIWLILNKTKFLIYDRVDKLIEAENTEKHK